MNEDYEWSNFSDFHDYFGVSSPRVCFRLQFQMVQGQGEG